MQVSLNWLSDYLDLSQTSVETISTSLTAIGLEVEAVEAVSSVTGDLVVGQIQSVSAHPDADRLRLTRVVIGESIEPLSIVCGAPNVREGMKVAVAKIGTSLPGGVKIKKSKVRGQESCGMLCSGSELNISSDQSGILDLDDQLVPGTDLVEYFQLKDTVFHLGLTPNRSDCNGYIGIARDLAAKLGVPFQCPEAVVAPSDYQGPKGFELAIERVEDCGRFVALAMTGVKAIPSPSWLSRRLESSGLRAINLIVDATNYVMLEFGQPIHAYDQRDIKGPLIQVRRAREGERLKTLDGNDHQLLTSDLVIADANSVIGLAGIMGGADSEVKADTCDIIIEVAHFDGARIRKTAKRLALHTDASHRFERGVDVTALELVASRVSQLITEAMVAAGHGEVRTAQNSCDFYPSPPQPQRIALRMDRLRKVTGLSLWQARECREILERLGFKQLDQMSDRLLFEVPSWRHDIQREVDLIEELSRLKGYDSLGYTLPQMEIKPLFEDPFVEFVEQCKIASAAAGFNEVITFPFCSAIDIGNLQVSRPHPMAATVALANPLAEDQKFLSTTTIVNLIKAVAKNRRLGSEGCLLFEVARGFYQAPAEQSGYLGHCTKQGRHITGRALGDQRPIERMILGLVIDQSKAKKTWRGDHRPLDFFDLKAAVLQILEHLGVVATKLSVEGLNQLPWMHPGISAVIVSAAASELVMGYIGELHPLVAKAYDFALDQAPLVCELDLESVFQLASSPVFCESASTFYPPVTRDFAFVVDRAVSHQDFCDAIHNFKKRHLKHFELFDMYQGPTIAMDKKSMAYAFSFQSDKKTLTDQDVGKEVARLHDFLAEQLGATLRQ